MENTDLNREGFFAMQSHRHYNFLILAMGFLIFVFVPFFILTPGQSKQVFNNGREFQVATDITILIGMFYALVGGFYWFMCLIRCKGIAASMVRFLFCWVALSGFLFPLTTNHTMFEIMSSPLHRPNYDFVLILSIAITVLWESKYAKTITIFMMTFLLIAILPTVPRAFSQFEKQNGEAGKLQLSQENNLLLVGLDGLPGHIVSSVLMQNSVLEHAFKDFTIYENVSSTSPATEASLMGMVYGNHDFTTWEQPFPIALDDLYFNEPDRYNFYSLDKYNIYNETGTKLSAGRYGVAEQRNELYEMYRNVAVRLFSKVGVYSMMIVDENKFPNRGGKFYWTTEGYDTIINSLEAGNSKPTIIYSHFAFTHWPTSIDENCVSRKTDQEWMRDNENVQGIKAGAICGIDKYKVMLDRLKDINRYDNTTIVLYSDHGKPVKYYNTPPHNFEINASPQFGFDRYQPFLMIKPAGHQSESLTYKSRRVLLDDIAQTACYLMGNKEECEVLTGVDILNPNDVAPDDFFIHVAKNKTSKWFLQDHKAVKLSRKTSLETAMQKSDEIILTEQIRP